ncbi:GNAT family N-acetyltransferase [Pseudomonas sp. NPDC087612]|uniref:GNAT family N-acetyltransferase n=1 Tax=Pseudomonas sp. NPDC087612 TaxID=3364441 RepID=UPI00380A541D
MNSKEKLPARHVQVVLTDPEQRKALQARLDQVSGREMLQVCSGENAWEQWREVCFEIKADNESVGYIVERGWPTLEIFRMFIFPEHRLRGIGKKAVASWKLLRLANGFTSVQLEIDDESHAFWQSTFPWYEFCYSGVHSKVPLLSDADNVASRARV